MKLCIKLVFLYTTSAWLVCRAKLEMVTFRIRSQNFAVVLFQWVRFWQYLWSKINVSSTFVCSTTSGYTTWSNQDCGILRVSRHTRTRSLADCAKRSRSLWNFFYESTKLDGIFWYFRRFSVGKLLTVSHVHSHLVLPYKGKESVLYFPDSFVSAAEQKNVQFLCIFCLQQKVRVFPSYWC